MSDDLAALLDPPVKAGASENTARILLEMIDDDTTPRFRRQQNK